MRRFLPSTQALICFEAAARHQSYTLAAQELALTQSAVSRQIAALEEMLKLALFQRTRHGVRLTQAGSHYWRSVRQWLGGLEQTTLELMAHHGKSTSLSLAAVPTFATRWLVPRLPSLARVHPELTVHIDVRTRPFLFEETHFDAAIFTGTPDQIANWPSTKAIHLMNEHIVPVCSPSLLDKLRLRGAGRAHQPVLAHELARLPLLQQSTRPRAWQQWFSQVGVSNQKDKGDFLHGSRYELFSMLTEAAICGLGVALVPPLLIESELAQGRLIIASPQPLQLEYSYYLVMPEDKEKDNQERYSGFIRWLVGELDCGSKVGDDASGKF